MTACKGTIAHGTGCGLCRNCEAEKNRLSEVRPVSVLVNEAVLDLWLETVEDKQLREIIRLAGHGLWAERFEDPIVKALNEMMGRQPRGSISSYERALDALPGKRIPLSSLPQHTKVTELEPT